MSGILGSGTNLPCASCGKIIYVVPSRLRRSKRHFCGTKCQMSWLHERFRAGAWRDTLRKGQQKRYQGHRVKIICPGCGKERLWALSDARRGRKFCNTECYLKWFRSYIAEHKEEWVLRSKPKSYKQPNSVESKLLSILNSYFPDEWLYTGAGRYITIKGMRPDFFNKNDRKEVIEVFGDYYHLGRIKDSVKQAARKLALYSEFGFHCLILWEHEIKEMTPIEIAVKVDDFRRNYEESKHETKG